MRGLFLILLVNRSASAVALPSDRSRASSNASALSRFGDPQLNVAPRLVGRERRLASLLFGESGQLLLDDGQLLAHLLDIDVAAGSARSAKMMTLSSVTST